MNRHKPTLRLGIRPYFSVVKQQSWQNAETRNTTPGVLFVGMSGIAAHLTKQECYDLADQLVDLAEQLPETSTTK